MRKLFISECTLTSAGKAYESILRGTLPDLTVIAKEHALYFTSIPPFEPTGNFYTVQTPITQKNRTCVRFFMITIFLFAKGKRQHFFLQGNGWSRAKSGNCYSCSSGCQVHGFRNRFSI